MIDYSSREWSYMLGVIHGDGHVAKRSVEIAVSYKEAAYADTLVAMWKGLGFQPKVYRPRSALRINVHSAALADDLRETKLRGLWTIPQDVRVGDYFAGIIDTDGHATKPPQRQVVVTLKRSGNLHRLCDKLVGAGLRCNPVKERTSSYLGRPYEIEELRWSGGDQIKWIATNCPLRHPRKADRLLSMQEEVLAIKADVPLWRRVAEWIAGEARDYDEIRARFSLTKRQADSVMDNIKANCRVEIIPPPRVLTKYRVMHG